MGSPRHPRQRSGTRADRRRHVRADLRRPATRAPLESEGARWAGWAPPTTWPRRCWWLASPTRPPTSPVSSSLVDGGVTMAMIANLPRPGVGRRRRAIRSDARDRHARCSPVGPTRFADDHAAARRVLGDARSEVTVVDDPDERCARAARPEAVDLLVAEHAALADARPTRYDAARAEHAYRHGDRHAGGHRRVGRAAAGRCWPATARRICFDDWPGGATCSAPRGSGTARRTRRSAPVRGAHRRPRTTRWCRDWPTRDHRRVLRLPRAHHRHPAAAHRSPRRGRPPAAVGAPARAGSRGDEPPRSRPRVVPSIPPTPRSCRRSVRHLLGRPHGRREPGVTTTPTHHRHPHRPRRRARRLPQQACARRSTTPARW